MNADFSHTCEGCEHVVTEPWAKDIISYRCFAPGRCKGRVVGVKRFDPYIQAWCPKLERSRENGWSNVAKRNAKRYAARIWSVASFTSRAILTRDTERR